MRGRSAACDFDGTEFLLHAVGQAKGPHHQRAQRQRAEQRRRIQGVACTRLRLLFDQAFAPGQADQKRRQEFSDRAAVDDQPLIPRAPPRISALVQPAAGGETLAIIELWRRDVLHERDREPADQTFGAPVELGLPAELRLDAGDHASCAEAA
jgi:hypothetical protein